MQNLWSSVRRFFTISDSSAVHGIVVRKLRLSFYITHYLCFKDPYVDTEYRIVSVAERSMKLRFSATAMACMASFYLINVLVSKQDVEHSFVGRVAVFTFELVWASLAVTISFTPALHFADWSAVWNVGNAIAFVVTSMMFFQDIRNDEDILTVSVFISHYRSQLATIAYQCACLIVLPFFHVLCTAFVIITARFWFVMALKHNPEGSQFSSTRDLIDTIFYNFCIISVSYFRERDKCSDFILRRIRSNKDAPRNLEAGVIITDLVEKNIGHEAVATIAKNQGQQRMCDENATNSIEDCVSGDDLKDLPDAPSLSFADDAGMYIAAEAFVPKNYSKSEPSEMLSIV